MRGALLVIALVLVHFSAWAQVEKRLSDRHAHIGELQRAEDHPATIREIELQIKEAPGTTWQDSIYRYTYAFGRAVWKTKGADAGAAAAERIVELVKARDSNVLHQLDAMDDLARLLFGMGRMLECARVDSVSLVFADRHAEVPLVRRGRARQRLAADHAAMGDHERGLKYYLEAKAVFERSDTLLALNIAEVCNGAGASCWHLGRNREADVYYGMALDQFAKSRDPRRSFRMAGTLINKGILWQDAGDFPRSKANYLESIRICGAMADTASDPLLREEAVLGRTRGYVNLATVYFALGDDGRSRELLELALKDRQRILEPDDPKLLGVQDRLADLEMEAGNFKAAEGHVRRYLEACERSFGTGSEEYMRTCAKLGEVCAGLGQTDRADSLFDRSIALQRAAADEATDPDLAIALRRRAQFRLNGGRYEEAAQDLLDARAIVERVHDGTYYKLAMYDALLAQVAFERNDPQQARRYANDALSVLGDRVKALQGSPVPQSFSQPHLLPDALYYRVLAERMIDPGAMHHERWLADLDLGILSLSRNKLSFDDEDSRLGLIGKQKNLFHLAIDIAYEDRQRKGTVEALDRILNLAEADRSILLKSRLNDFRGLRFAGVPDSIIQREGQLTDALIIDPDDPGTAQDLDQKEKALNVFLDRLSRDHPEYFALRYGEPRVTVAELRKRLVTPTRDLLAYTITSEHLYMLVVRTDTAALVRVSNKGLSQAVKALNAAVIARDAAAYVKCAPELYAMVFAPVADLLRHDELLIIPDGELQKVNFEALLDRPSTTAEFRKHLLLQRYSIAYLLSATTAVQFAELDELGAQGTLALAPGFDDTLKKDYMAQVEDSTQVDRQFMDLVRQPFAVTTAQGLGSLLSAKVMVGGDASEKGFRALAAQYGILHLGTHAEMNAAAPMYSRFVLSKDGTGVDADSDGYLHAYEIYDLDLRAQLAVLTACETGAGKDDDGEGVRSLGYSFAYAGCPSLVVSLWKIDEKVSSQIITRFYEHLADGMPKHQALRQAKLDHLEQATDETSLPYYWAGMVLVGDTRPIEVGAFLGRNLWYVLITGALLLMVFLMVRRRRSRA